MSYISLSANLYIEIVYLGSVSSVNHFLFFVFLCVCVVHKAGQVQQCRKLCDLKNIY